MNKTALRAIFPACLSLLAPAVARAHFVFVIPDKGGHSASVVLSEELKPDEQVPIQIIGGTKLTSTDTAGVDAALKLAEAEHSYKVELGAPRAQVIHGVTDLGVVKRGESKPGIIIYYPKTILGDPFDAKTRVKDAAMELVPSGSAGKMRLLVLYGGKPAPDAEVNVMLPDGSENTVTADKDGYTSEFQALGRYGAWARHVEPTAGDLNGKHYDEVRKYATLVIDVPATAFRNAAPDAAGKPEAKVSASVTKFGALPYAAASFGAVACDGYLYVYGGHIVPTHSYSTEAVTGRFARLKLDGGTTWEELPPGPPCQGMNLAAANGRIYRAGGMQPRNKPSEPEDNHSLAEAAVFDPATKGWSTLPALPAGRSSHDLVVADGKLLALGGWSMSGKDGENKWLESAVQLDLANPTSWQPVAQPFQRRALIAYPHAGKVYVIGGFNENDEASLDVEILDTATGTWAKGPAIPGKQFNGFSPAACEWNGKLYLSVGDGSLYRLDEAGKAWEKVAQSTPRIVHRMVPSGDRLLIIGGATSGKNLELIESYKPE